MPKELPDVTVVIVDTVAHDLARKAVLSTLRQITPAAVHVWSDSEIAAPLLRGLVKFFRIEPLADIEGYNQTLWYRVPDQVRTSHFLIVQWDGWVIDGEAWRDEFLDYDYIGAPWHWHSHYQVGNGGFSLRSLRLHQYLAACRNELPGVFPEDDRICRTYRPQLELVGIRFAPVPLAAHFSFEHMRPGDHSTFGFHDIRNWGWVLSDEEIDARLAVASAYVVKKTQLIETMLKNRDAIRQMQAAGVVR
jgi:hypothetical protein